jgi:hypothetical protein
LLEPVRASYGSGQSLQWTRVNQLPDFVFFNHSIHVNKGVGCNTCHGPVDQMPLMYQQESLQMEWCLGCHRAPQNKSSPARSGFQHALPAAHERDIRWWWMDRVIPIKSIRYGVGKKIQRSQRERHHQLQHVPQMKDLI